MTRVGLITAWLGTLGLVTGALAQGSKVRLDAPVPTAQKPGPDVRVPPQAELRLAPGAALCRTEADLNRLNARRGGESVGGPIDCQIIRDPTIIAITQRKGPGRTEVRLTGGDGSSGWTDAWLPSKAPPAARSAAR